VVRKDIKTGDLVLKRKKNWENPGKLQEPWEGPLIAKETSMPAALMISGSNPSNSRANTSALKLRTRTTPETNSVIVDELSQKTYLESRAQGDRKGT
jgi:hypothetical protein